MNAKLPNVPIISITPVGSRVTCNPAPTNTDDDYLVFVDASNLQEFLNECVFHSNYDFGGSFHGKDHKAANSVFYSLKSGEINLIVTDKEWFNRRFLAASSLAKHFNLLEKSDRVRLFQAVLYGN